MALLQHLNATGACGCVYANIEAAQACREDMAAANRVFATQIAEGALTHLKDPYPRKRSAKILSQSGSGNAFGMLLADWCRQDPRPMVLLLDEVDALIGDSLLSLLRQLRAGYPNRPGEFPQSVILCGVRDIRDYRIHSSRENQQIAGGSAFNIKAESLRLGDFSRAEVQALYAQHTLESGQRSRKPLSNGHGTSRWASPGW